MNVDQVSAVLVTHMDVNLSRIKESLEGFGEVIVWDNERLNLGPLGQFIAAAHLAKNDVVYFQDDDCVTDPRRIVELWEPDRVICNLGTAGHAANYVDRPDKLMGFGSCFERGLIKPTFELFWKWFPLDYVSWREPGRIFTAMNRDKTHVVEVPFENLFWATAEYRLYKQPEHKDTAQIAIERALSL